MYEVLSHFLAKVLNFSHIQQSFFQKFLEGGNGEGSGSCGCCENVVSVLCLHILHTWFVHIDQSCIDAFVSLSDKIFEHLLSNFFYFFLIFFFFFDFGVRFQEKKENKEKEKKNKLASIL